MPALRRGANCGTKNQLNGKRHPSRRSINRENMHVNSPCSIPNHHQQQQQTVVKLWQTVKIVTKMEGNVQLPLGAYI